VAVAVPAAGSPVHRSGPQALGNPTDSQTLRLLFIGASVTEGWFASAPSRTYTSIVARDLSSRGRRVRTRILARPGALAGEADGWDLAIPSDIIVVQLATNDFVQSLPVVDFASSYTDVLDRLRRASPAADIICMGGWDDPASRNRLGITANDYDIAARSACEAEGGHYVDLSGVYMTGADHGPQGRPTFRGAGDVFHPNDRGHAALAALVLEATDPRD